MQMDKEQYWQLMTIAKKEARKRGQTVEEYLHISPKINHLRPNIEITERIEYPEKLQKKDNNRTLRNIPISKEDYQKLLDSKKGII